MNHSQPPESRGWRGFASAGSSVLCVLVSLCLMIQPDWMAPVILVPAWCWLIPGLFLAACGFRRRHRRWLIVALILWSGFTLLFVDEARSLTRIQNMSTTEWQTVRKSGRGIRVVSLNCNVGQFRSAREITVWQPDIVLLQESPRSEQLEQLAAELFGTDGTFLHGGDVSILARGELRPQFSNPASHFVHAEVALPTGVIVDVISVRLAPPVPRLDFWMPGFWIKHRNRRLMHRDQILEIMQHIRDLPTTGNLIIGGDFNSPANDAALAALRPRLSDTFRNAGRGWGATGTNEYPLFRVDQIWTSDSLQAESVTVRKTLHSDHRMVVCDLTFEAP